MTDERRFPDELAGRPEAGEVVLAALRESLTAAERALDRVGTLAERRESVRAARRELKAARALALLLRLVDSERGHQSLDGVLECAAKANQLLGPLRDRDALARSIQRIADRFADAETRRVSRTVLLATLVFADAGRRDDAQFATSAIERARRAIRHARVLLDDAVTIGPVAGSHAAATLCRSLDDCRDMLENALEHNDLSMLHACRKNASLVALSLRPFGESLPSPLRRLRSRSKLLAAALGEDRDLALLEVELRVARAKLEGSPFLAAIDDSLRLARIESFARAEDAGRAFLRLAPNQSKRELRELF